jgi:hypothetical protein
MPNQVNYPDPIPVPYIEYRPERLSEEDRNLVQSGIKQILFGTTARDYAELWVYDSNGGIAGHVNLDATNPTLNLATVISNTGAYELLDINMGEAVRTMLVESGRYGFTANFFRDEVGSEYVDNLKPELGSGNRLYITDISDDRTELRLSPKTVNQTIVDEIYEWVLPSVPKLYAQALIDQTFGRSLPTELDAGGAVPDYQVLSHEEVTVELDKLDPTTYQRIQRSNATTAYQALVTTVTALAGQYALENMAMDVRPSNTNIQQADIERYISEALAKAIHQVKSAGTDPRFEIINL